MTIKVTKNNDMGTETRHAKATYWVVEPDGTLVLRNDGNTNEAVYARHAWLAAEKVD